MATVSRKDWPNINLARAAQVLAEMEEAAHHIKRAGVPTMSASTFIHDAERVAVAIDRAEAGTHSLTGEPDFRMVGLTSDDPPRDEIQCPTLPGLCCAECNHRPPHPDGSCHCAACTHLEEAIPNGDWRP